MNPIDYVGKCFVLGMHDSQKEFRVFEIVELTKNDIGQDAYKIHYHDTKADRVMLCSRIIGSVTTGHSRVFTKEIEKSDIPAELDAVKAHKYRIPA